MTWATPGFSIGGVVIEVPASLGLTQSYEDEGGAPTLRMGSGRPLRQKYWTRVKTVITCEGAVPAGLSDLDWTAPMLVQSPTPRSKYAAANSVSLPVNRRADVPPVALAWVRGYPHPTPVAMDGDTATATPVTDADGYTFSYWPQFNALVTKPESSDRTSSSFSWSLTAQEV